MTKPQLHASGDNTIRVSHPTFGKTNLYCLPSPQPVGPNDNEEIDYDAEGVEPDLMFTENNTNYQRLYGGSNDVPYVKDAFHDHIIPSHRPKSDGEGHFFNGRIHSRRDSIIDEEEPEQGPRTPFPSEPSFVNPERKGTKAGAHYVFENVPGNGGCAVVRLKLTPHSPSRDGTIEDEGLFDDSVEQRREEADEFYNSLVLGPISDDLKQIMRQALGGMMWTKQYYQFIQKPWLEGDPAQPPPPPERKYVRNRVSSMTSVLCSTLTKANRTGNTCTLRTSFQCRISTFTLYSSSTSSQLISDVGGNTHSSPHGTLPSTAFRSRSWTRHLQRSSLISSLGSGI